MKRVLTIFLHFFISSFMLLSAEYKILTNGGAEEIILNDIKFKRDYTTEIFPDGRGMLSYWKFSNSAKLCSKEKKGGKYSVLLIGNDKDSTARIESNMWHSVDPEIKFGVPVFPEKTVIVSFFYKTSKEVKKGEVRAILEFGVDQEHYGKEKALIIKNIDLIPSSTWTKVEKKYKFQEFLLGANIEFILKGKKGGENRKIWIDDVRIIQPSQDKGVNLVRNGDFEISDNSGIWPKYWDIAKEDQWVSWVGENYRKPVLDSSVTKNGKFSLRESVVYGDISSLSQRIRINQKKTKPIIISLWTKLDNSIGNSPPHYNGPDNLANLNVHVYYTDGTMVEVSPTFILGITDHDWRKKVFGIMAKKPIEEVSLRFIVLGSEPTTSLWIDDVRFFEYNSGEKELRERNVFLPPKKIISNRGKELNDNGLFVSNDNDNIYMKIPFKNNQKEVKLYLNPLIRITGINHRRYLYHVLKIHKEKSAQWGLVTEKQGYTAEGLFEPAKSFGISVKRDKEFVEIKIPFKAIKMNRPSFEPFGVNFMWIGKDGKKTLWTGRRINNREMGRLILAKRKPISFVSLEFGDAYYNDRDQSDDFISYPQIYAGENRGRLVLSNKNQLSKKIIIVYGMKDLKLNKKEIILPPLKNSFIDLKYNVGLKRNTEFVLRIYEEGKEIFNSSFPIIIPPSIEINTDKDFYYPSESRAELRIYDRYRPISKGDVVYIKIVDLKRKRVILRKRVYINSKKKVIYFPIKNLRINKLPIQDYKFEVILKNGKGQTLGKAEKPFGRIYLPEKRKLPPIKKVSVDKNGHAVINGNFKYFPIVPSVDKLMDDNWDEAIKMGANIFRAWFNKKTFFQRDRAWKKNAYTLTIGPGFDRKQLKMFESKEGENLIKHPGFFSMYGKQFYFWKLSGRLINYRKEVERETERRGLNRLIIWGHHDSSFLYDLRGPEWKFKNPDVGYCYVKIMGRPGPVWRNAPFLTLTERILHPDIFLLAEVNYYVSFHGDEIVSENYFGGGLASLRGDDWRGLKNETYQAVINGADGVYNWVCAQKRDIQRLRGYYSELNYMWPIFLSEDANTKVELFPFDSKINFMVKKWNGKIYLITANSSEIPQRATLKLNIKNFKVKKLFNLKGDMKVGPDVIKDIWPRYGVYVYEIKTRKRE